ncbi:MAG: hypothetical protein LBP67_09070 [Bacteroidales bacterium]|jgi:hypothetical protein|nr:hypothetical protein [Bacteroidales bacterium]
MEEWIYLALGFAWIVLSAVLSNKKKNSDKASTTNNKEITKSFKEEIKSVFSDSEDIFYKPEFLEEKNINKTTPSRTKIAPQTEKLSSPNVKILPSEKILTKKIQNEISQNSFDNQNVEEDNHFNLRQAIIFSEILRTPYID